MHHRISSKGLLCLSLCEI